jgi:predicted RNase H-like HicB family nuclease
VIEYRKERTVEAIMDFKVVLEYDPEEDCWVTYVPALDNVSTWGKTREEALDNTEEAIIGYLEGGESFGYIDLDLDRVGLHPYYRRAVDPGKQLSPPAEIMERK